ncbi:hypothetical protein [Streptomyces aurantiogriseus]|uniref:Lipoprotein n=1 Tax=Streptomyces aurantiogriseus TaxID=66870 RepID=A0A918BVX2_9ACTN|nr:hypothetical protein [Streptomyces aurantiogriseus]GGQ93537.1 hypothetical protein GCM10010251_05320 [Streptomyces aurantiogriseus]
MICRRPTGRRAGAVVLLLAAAGCSGSATGTIVYTTPADKEVTIQSPADDKCHRLPGGARHVTNHTVDDIRLYANERCVLTSAGENQSGRIGGESFYLGTQLSVAHTPGQSPWLSYRVIGGGG